MVEDISDGDEGEQEEVQSSKRARARSRAITKKPAEKHHPVHFVTRQIQKLGIDCAFDIEVDRETGVDYSYDFVKATGMRMGPCSTEMVVDWLHHRPLVPGFDAFYSIFHLMQKYCEKVCLTVLGY